MTDGVALFEAVNQRDPEHGRLTWATIDVAVTRATERLLERHGTPADRCAPGGSLDEVILMIHWDVATREDVVRVAGGRAADFDLPAPTRTCLDEYFALASYEESVGHPLVELNIVWETPLLAGVAGRAAKLDDAIP